MEALYKKLYAKYKDLKNKEESQFDKLNHDQEVKFLNFVAAADEMIQYLKSENDKLCGQVDELKSELASLRASSEEERVHYQKLLMEENHKNKELPSRLRKDEHNECPNCTTREGIECEQKKSRDAPGEGTQGESVARSTKKRKFVHNTEGKAILNVDVELDPQADQRVFGDMGIGAPPSIQQPACQRRIYSSGGDAADTSSVGCMFQHLVEFVVGMKVSPLTQSNELCILVHHQSSGYSFSLTWITDINGEVELLYRVLSLGTFERVAPEWMKETLMFSTHMCSVFFERVSRVIKT